MKLFSYKLEERTYVVNFDRQADVSQAVKFNFQYGYAYDGGKRWRKDIANAVWTWYPCGVACSAGELVEQTSDLTGNTWTNSATYLRGSSCSGGLIRRNSEYHHADLICAFPVITNGSGTVISSNLYDNFGVQRFTNGNVTSSWRWAQSQNEGLIRVNGSDYLPERVILPATPSNQQTVLLLAWGIPWSGRYICGKGVPVFTPAIPSICPAIFIGCKYTKCTLKKCYYGPCPPLSNPQVPIPIAKPGCLPYTGIVFG